MASRYFKTGATVWNSANSWSATSAAGADNAGIPTATDDAIFTSASGATCAVTTTAGVCLTLTTTGYTGTITTANSAITITVSGNITLSSSTTLAGNGALICNATATLTSANATINCPFTLTSTTGLIFTLADNWTINALFTTVTASTTLTINGNNIFCRGGFNINSGGGSAGLTTGTTVINITNTGTITTTANTSGGLGNTFIINAPGLTVTLPANLYYRTGTLKYIAGTLSGTSNLNITGTCTLDMNNGGLNYVTPFSLVIAVASTITMSSDWYLSGINVGQALTINGFNLYSTGTYVSAAATTGTTVLRLKGSGGGQAVSSAGAMGIDLSFEGSSNTINVTNITYAGRSGGGTVTYTSGTINNSGTLTLQGPNTITLNTSGMSWNNIIVTGTSFTVTINSLLSATGTMSFQNQVYTFAGTAGFTVGTLSWTAYAPATINTGIVLNSGNTYTVTSALNLYSITIPTYLGLKSSTPGSVAYLILSSASTQSVGNIQVTDIDSSGGQTILAWRPGTLSNTVNWKALTNPGTVVSTF
jgi:hypothetical protein